MIWMGAQMATPGRPEPAGYITPSKASMLPPTHPVSCGRNPIAFNSLRSALVVFSYGQHVDVKGGVGPNDVGHVVRNSTLRVAQKRTQRGQLRSIAACFAQPKRATMLRQLAKVQVGSSGAITLSR
jgi:hypothetical protein